MGARRKHSSHGGKHIRLEKWFIKSAAWQSLSPIERCIYLEIKYRHNGSNNGQIGLGIREASNAINMSKDSANRAFKRLIEVGFIEITKHSGFNRKNRVATEWLLTELKNDITGELAKKTFSNWLPVEKCTVAPMRRTVSPMRQSPSNEVQDHA